MDGTNEAQSTKHKAHKAHKGKAQGTVCVNPVEKFGLNGAKREYP